MNSGEKKSVLSLSNRTFVLAMSLIILIFAVSVYSFERYSSSYIYANAERSVKNISLAITERLNFYQDLVDKIARREDTRQVVEFGSHEEAQRWALEQRKYIPNSISLALVATDASILGDAGDLRVGPACRRDIEGFVLQNKHITLKLHDDVPQFAHFDVVSPIVDDSGSRIGVVFASFSINVLQTTLEKLSDPGSNVVLSDHHGHLITEFRRVQVDELYSVGGNVAGSDWHLYLELEPDKDSAIVRNLIIFLFAVALLFAGVMVVLSRRQVTGLLGEFDNIKQHLDAILEQTPNFHPRPARYRETEAILPTIHHLSGAIGSRNKYLSQLSETDQLTGLGNRRCFDEKIHQAWDSAKAGNQLYLIYLDLDHFKTCNDHYGHAKGDLMLQLFAQCLNQYTRQNDVLVRMGGDEFVALLEGIGEDILTEWYLRIAQCFNSKQEENGFTETTCSVSAGAMRMEVQAGKVEDIIRLADTALYQAKSRGRGQLVIQSSGP